MKHAHTLVTPSPIFRAPRPGISPFLGKGAGGMAHQFPAGERLRSPFLGKGAGGMADQGNPARVSGTRGASGAPAVTKGCA